MLWVVLAAYALQACGSTSSPPAPMPPTGMACGEERWAVKTLSDAEATRVDVTHAIPTTVTALNALTPRCSGLPDARSFAEEFQTFEVTGRVSATREEDDRDIHVVLADLADPGQTIITEVVDPTCFGAVQSPFLSLLTSARSQYQGLSPLTGKTVRVRGVGFYDFNHGQTDRSRSCIELHPVLSISVN